MRLIVGLGNPGLEYSHTRHNIGFRAVDQLAAEHALSLSRENFQAAYGIGFVGGARTIVAKPLTFMNRSGEAVAALAAHYTIPPAHITVIHDDMDIAFGRLRIKLRGGSAGHRGIESIQQHLGRSGFTRIRIGIGTPPPAIDPVEYVLQNFSDDEAACLEDVIRKTVHCVAALCELGPQAAMNEFHRSGA